MITDYLPNALLTVSENSRVICKKETMDDVKFPHSEFFTFITNDKEEIEKRNCIFRDVINSPKLLSLFENALEKLNVLASLYKKTGDVSSNDNETILYSLLEMLAFTDFVKIMAEGKSDIIYSELTSERFKNLFESTEQLSADEEFAALKDQLEKIESNLRDIRSVTLGVNLDAQFNVSEIGLVSINEHPYISGALVSKAFGKGKSSDDFTCLTSIGIREIKGMFVKSKMMIDNGLYSAINQVLKSSLKNLKKSITESVYPTVCKYLEIRTEIEFIVKAVKYLNSLISAGLPVVFPEISEKTEISSLYNPILLYKCSAAEIVPSNIIFDEASKTYILTGPNSGGKSIFLNAVGIAQMMFQLGFPITAKSAEMKIQDSIITHFIREIKETSESRLANETQRLFENIKSIRKNTLFLLDEVFSSTSAYDALFLSEELLKYLKKNRCDVIFVTHLHELAVRIKEKADEDYAGMKALSAKVNGGKRTYEIAESFGETADASLAKDVVVENGLGFLFE